MLRRGLILLAFLAVPVAAPANDVQMRVLADLVLAGHEDGADQNSMRTQDSYTDFLHTRLFIDAGNERTAFFLQLVLSDTAADPVRIFGAYLQHQILEDTELYVQAGKIPNPMGTWGPRTYADRNPLVGVPFAYYWQSSLPVGTVPASLDELVAQADVSSTYGALMLYDNCWNDGISLLGTAGWFSGLVSATRGAPGNPNAGASDNEDIAVQARVTVSPIPEVQASVSFGRGAYLNRSAGDALAPGQSVNDFDQNIFAGSIKLAHGYFELNGEYFYNRYETPLREEGLSSWSAYADLEWVFAPGWYAALRYDLLRFEEVSTSGGVRAWDTDLDRVEGGLGYHLSRSFLLKAVVQATDTGNGLGDDPLPLLQAVVKF